MTPVSITKPVEINNVRSQVAAPLKNLSRSMSPILVDRKLEFKKQDTVTKGTFVENKNNLDSRKKLDVVLHRHPLHVDRNGSKSQNKNILPPRDGAGINKLVVI